MRILYLRGLAAAIVLSIYGCTGNLYAQIVDADSVKVENLEQLYVTGTAKPSSARQSVPIQTMDRSAIERLGVQDLYEAVRTFSGVSLKDYGGVGGVKTVSIRNMGSQHTAICYDGVTMSNAQNGQIDIGRISLDNVGQVSLSVGQSDDIFQTARMFASAGALNIKTQKPRFTDKGVNVGVHMRVASFGTYNPYLIYQQRLSENWSFSVNGDWLKSDGTYPFTMNNGTERVELLRTNSDVNAVRGEINVYGEMGRGGTLTIKGNYDYSERGLPGSVVLYRDDANERLWDRNGFATLQYENRLDPQFTLKTNLKYTYSWTRYLNINDIYASGKEETFYTQNEYYGSVAGKYTPGESWTITLAEDLFVNTLESTLADFVYPTRYTSLTSLAGQYKRPRVTVTASLLGVYVTERVRVGDAAADKWRVSPSLSVSYKLFEESNLRIRASYKDGFRVPTFNDLYYSRVGNRDLNPERASQYNLGLTWNGAIWQDVIEYSSISIDGYYNRVKEKIVAIPTMFIWRMLNVGEVSMSGVDINSVFHISLPHMMSLILNANYSYQHAIDISDHDSKTYRHQIPYTPKHSGNLSLSWKSPWINVSYLCSAVGERYSFPQNTQANLIDGYFDHSVSVSRDFALAKHRITVVGEVLNIGDVNYEVVQYYPMPGRSYRLTLKYNF